VSVVLQNLKGSLERSEAERSKAFNTATAVTTKLQLSNAAQSVDMIVHTIKPTNLCSATLRSSVSEP